MPDEGEINANKLLIEKGAVPVDFHGNKIENISYITPKDESVDKKIYYLLANSNGLTSKQVIEKLRIDWSVKKLTSYLKAKENIEKLNTKPVKFRLKSASSQDSLFQ